MFSPYRPKPLAFQLKKLGAAVAMAMLFSQANAAGWGDLAVHSALGQPLRADIELISATAQEDGPLSVRLASVDAYRRANIEFNPVLMSLRFAVEQRGARQVVHVTSTQPVNEPYVDMLLELSSGSGRMVREFVFLLDPAATDAAPLVAAAPVDNATAAAVPARKPAIPAPRAPVPPAASAKPRLSLTNVSAVSATDSKAGVVALDDYATMEKQVAEANARVKALEQKVNELQTLLEATNGLLAQLQKQNETIATPAKLAAQEPPAATTPLKTAPPVPAIPVAAAPAPAAAPPAAVPSEPETDYLIPGAALLTALLGAAGLYASRRRKAKHASEAGFRDDVSKPTAAATGLGSTHTTAMATGLLLPTGIGHTHEVDPLAEADVYIAYGRDVQAEDILKEALSRQPERHPVRVKLLSIYAGRKDVQSFDALAHELHRMTNGEGEDWQQAAELGREIAPANALYAAQPVQAVAPEQELVLERAGDFPIAEPADSSPLPDLVANEETSPTALGSVPVDVDFDLDNLHTQAEPLPVIAPVADESPVAGPGPIDFDFIKPAQLAEQDFAAIPELSVAAPELPPALLEEAKPDEALLDFDFLQPDTGTSKDRAGR